MTRQLLDRTTLMYAVPALREAFQHRYQNTCQALDVGLQPVWHEVAV